MSAVTDETDYAAAFVVVETKKLMTSPPHAPVVLDIAGHLAQRRRPAPPATPPDRRPDLLHPQLGKTAAAHRLTAEIKSIRPDMLICVDHEGGRVQRFRTDGFTHPARDARLRRVVDEGCDARHRRRHRQPAMCWRRTARLRRRPQLHAGARPRPWRSAVIGDRAFHRDPRVGDAARQEPDARPAARRHAQLRQTLPRPRLCHRRLARRHSGRQALAEDHPGRRRPALRLAQRPRLPA